MFMALPIVLGLASCTEHDNPVDNDQVTTDIDPTSVNEFKPEVLTMASLWVAPGVDADLKQAFDWGTATTESTPEEGSVLVLNKLTDVSEAVLQNALENGGTEYLICVVNPDKAEFEAYAESHDWFDVEADNVTDSTFIYGFNAVNRRYIIQKPVTEEGADPVLENINRAQNYYVYISAMLNDFGRSQQNGSNDKEDGKTSMEDFASHYHYAVTKTFNVEKTFREVLWSSADKLSGSFTATANYDVYMVHVYEGEPGEGDYYGVRMTASIASANMWKGKGDNTHGGVHVGIALSQRHRRGGGLHRTAGVDDQPHIALRHGGQHRVPVGVKGLVVVVGVGIEEHQSTSPGFRRAVFSTYCSLISRRAAMWGWPRWAAWAWGEVHRSRSRISSALSMER